MIAEKDWEYLTGFVWQIYPISEDANPVVDDFGSRYGFHGNDIYPTKAEFLAGSDDDTDTWLVLTKDSNKPDVPEGWVARRINLDDGWSYSDGTWFVKKHKSLESIQGHEHCVFKGRI